MEQPNFRRNEQVDQIMNDIEHELRDLVERQKIYDVLTRYCRGVDRGDVELIKSAYHDDAVDDHGMFKGTGKDFAEWIVDFLKDTRQCQHLIGNFSCELHGDVAYTETYCLSINDTGKGEHFIAYNRYIDRFEKRAGEWKIAERCVVLDVTRNVPATEPIYEQDGWEFTWGRKDKLDPVYRR